MGRESSPNCALTPDSAESPLTHNVAAGASPGTRASRRRGARQRRAVRSHHVSSPPASLLAARAEQVRPPSSRPRLLLDGQQAAAHAVLADAAEARVRGGLRLRLERRAAAEAGSGRPRPLACCRPGVARVGRDAASSAPSLSSPGARSSRSAAQPQRHAQPRGERAAVVERVRGRVAHRICGPGGACRFSARRRRATRRRSAWPLLPLLATACAGAARRAGGRPSRAPWPPSAPSRAPRPPSARRKRRSGRALWSAGGVELRTERSQLPAVGRQLPRTERDSPAPHTLR